MLITKGKYIKVYADYVSYNKDNGLYKYRISNDDFLSLPKDWHKFGKFVIYADQNDETNKITLLSGLNDFEISLINRAYVYVKIGDLERTIVLEHGIEESDPWYAFAIVLHSDSINVRVYLNKEGKLEEISNTLENLKEGTLTTHTIDRFYVTPSDVYMSNIRLYENTMPYSKEEITLDLSAYYVRNNSKALVNDSVQPEMYGIYYGVQR